MVVARAFHACAASMVGHGAAGVCRLLCVRQHKRRAGSVHLKIRFGGFQTITRSQTLSEPTDSTAELWIAARNILEAWAAKSFSPVRLIGTQASSLTDEPRQEALFVDHAAARQQKLDRAVDAINQRLGNSSIHRGGAKH